MTNPAAEAARIDREQLTAPWFAKRNDVIGEWCVMPVDATPGESVRPEVADFTTQVLAEHIADLHNQWLAAEDWPFAPDGSPYARLKAYVDGALDAPAREDVMELLRAFNGASAMNRVHRRVIDRQKRRFTAVRALTDAGEPVAPGDLYAALATGREDTL